MTSWQERLTSNYSRLSYIWRNGDISDVTFVVGVPPDQKRFKVHKLILSMCSKVFFNMFYGPQRTLNEVHVPEFKPAIFEIAMSHLYEESFTVSNMKEAFDTFRLAHMYNMDHLRNLCIIYVNDHLDYKNIHILYGIPGYLETLQVRAKCETVLREKTSDILKSENFVDSPLGMVKHMLQLDDLSIETEKELFDAILKWARTVCRKRNPAYTTADLRAEMDKFLPHIRFLSMSVQEFVESPTNSGILTASERDRIRLNLTTTNIGNLPYWCNSLPSRNPIKSFRLISDHICRSVGIYVDYIECEIWLARGSMSFRGISVYVSLEGDIDFSSLSFSVKHNSETVASNFTVSYDATSSLLKYTLEEPLELKLFSSYAVSLNSQHAIFPKCTILSPRCFAKSSDRCKIMCTLKLSQQQLFALDPLNNSLSHIYEIFYT